MVRIILVCFLLTGTIVECIFPSNLQFAVRLQIQSKKLCSGTLLLKNWVLTTAHCVWLVPPEEIKAYFGETLNGTDSEVNIHKVCPHEEFNLNDYRNNIALLKLSTPVDFEISPHPFALFLDQLIILDFYPENVDFITIGWYGRKINNRHNRVISLTPESEIPGCQPQDYTLRQFCLYSKLSNVTLDSTHAGSPVFIKTLQRNYTLIALLSYIKTVKMTRVYDVDLGTRRSVKQNYYIVINLFEYLEWVMLTVRTFTERKEISTTFQGIPYFSNSQDLQNWVNKNSMVTSTQKVEWDTEDPYQNSHRRVQENVNKPRFRGLHKIGTHISQLGVDGAKIY